MLVLAAASGALGACGDDEYRRPQVEPGKVVTVLTRGTPGVSKKSLLTDIALGTDGVLYAAFKVGGPASRDSRSGLVLAVPAKGKPFVVADQAKHTFPEPVQFLPDALTIDPTSGTLYLTDSISQRIRAIKPGGQRRNVVEFGGRVQGPPGTYLRQPAHLTIDPASGTLYMADGCQVARIQGDQITVLLGADSSQCTLDPSDSFGAGAKSPDTGVLATEVGTSTIGGLAFDGRSGRLVVVDALGAFSVEADGRLRRLAGEGEGAVPFRDGAVNRAPAVDMDFATGARVDDGGGIAIDPAGTLYLGAPLDNLVMRVTADVIEKVAVVKEPRRLALGADGNLFAALSQQQSGEPVVQVIAPGG